jgi:hypothetical protein
MRPKRFLSALRRLHHLEEFSELLNGERWKRIAGEPCMRQTLRLWLVVCFVAKRDRTDRSDAKRACFRRVKDS